MIAIAGTDDEMGMASAPAEPLIGIEGKCKCTRHVRPHRRRVSMKMPSRGTAMTPGILIIAGLLVMAADCGALATSSPAISTTLGTHVPAEATSATLDSGVVTALPGGGSGQMCDLPGTWPGSCCPDFSSTCLNHPSIEDWTGTGSAFPPVNVSDTCSTLSMLEPSMDARLVFDNKGLPGVTLNPDIPAYDNESDIILVLQVFSRWQGLFACELIKGPVSDQSFPVSIYPSFTADFLRATSATIEITVLPVTTSQLQNKSYYVYKKLTNPMDALQAACRRIRCDPIIKRCICRAAAATDLHVQMVQEDVSEVNWSIGAGEPVDDIYLAFTLLEDQPITVLNVHLPGSARSYTVNTSVVPINTTVPYFINIATEFEKYDASGKSDLGKSGITLWLIPPRWTNWTWTQAPCNAPCSINDSVQMQRRRCEPAAKDAVACPVSEETRTVKCPSEECQPVDGGWSRFSRWSECVWNRSEPCAPAVQRRNRTCNNPVPRYFGQACNGSDVEYLSCSSGDEECSSGNYKKWLTLEVLAIFIAVIILPLLGAVIYYKKCHPRPLIPYVYVCHCRPDLPTYLKEIRNESDTRRLLKFVNNLRQTKLVLPHFDINEVNSFQDGKMTVKEFFKYAYLDPVLIICNPAMREAFDRASYPHDMTWPQQLTRREVELIKASPGHLILAIIPEYVGKSMAQEDCVPEFLQGKVQVIDMRSGGTALDVARAVVELRRTVDGSDYVIAEGDEHQPMLATTNQAPIHSIELEETYWL